MSGPTTLHAPLLAGVPGVRHAFFTRRGGVSRGLYASLNVGPGSGDAAEAVAENRRRAADWFGARPQALFTCHQIHSDQVVVAQGPATGERPRADGVVTTRHGLVCGALAADCAPVLIADGEARVVAAVHAGWRGALAGVVEGAVRRMESLGAIAGRMVAAVGPCIGPASYEVGLDFLARFEAEAPGSECFFSPGVTDEKRLFDLPAFVLSRLAACGVAGCEALGRDTCAEEDLFFSNRRANRRGEGDYGRLLSAIMLVA